MTRLIVRSCGPMTSLQDAGRVGWRRFGVSSSGAMDRLALAHANVLVGNGPGAAGIEMTLMGGLYEAADEMVRLAVAGAPAAVSAAGRPVAPGTSVTLKPGETLSVGPAQAGVFMYLAVAGGLAVPPELDSLSLHPRAGIGGLHGRPLRAGDELPLRDIAPAGPELALDPVLLDPDAPIRVVLGPQADYFGEEAVAAFLDTSYVVSPEADRMGYRLAGPPIAHLHGFNIVSDGIVAGSVQVPGSGVPIVMMVDHQTTGGYPKIATVITPDLRILAQRRPGAPVRFRAIPIEEAQELARAYADCIANLSRAAKPIRGVVPDVEALLGLNLAGHASNALAPEP
ncbi:biotin-dependent carboxyltransferase family protein [Enterovirga aerilata]|uniref:Biotin-dependent carboxyltransferase n=1 Tax=Enterovirga aerilata TaxID=2730920 RepID=A0A849I8D6_9HYPH|nr:biotin-dependent carboxyltransferase family protein [Enterovirga sp. DB1703]NNM73658.1 biotin-dependent carboxyltransferase [Enterovirga sp. DB1703]